MPNRRPNTECEICGTGFYATPSNKAKGWGRFCSNICHAEDMRGKPTGRATHGETGSRTYNTWQGMTQRCTNPNHVSYEYYGGRGVEVCERWRSYQSFVADMGEKPDGMSLDRIDNSKGYSSDNCRWATHEEQCNNQRKNRPITARGITKNLSQWAREVDMPVPVLHYRINAGWTPEKALFTPIRGRD